jgi:hypothetical protein
MKNIFTVIFVALFLVCSVLPSMAESYIDWSLRSDCYCDDQGNCSDCFNYAAIEFYGWSEKNIPTLTIILDGEAHGAVRPECLTKKKGKEVENPGCHYSEAVPVRDGSGYYGLELKHGKKVYLSGYVEIPELVVNIWDIAATDTGDVSITINLTPMFGKEVPTGAAGITIAGALSKLGTISEGDYGSYNFIFSLSRQDIIQLKDSNVEIVLNIAGEYVYANVYFWSPYDSDYSSAKIKIKSMAKAKKIARTITKKTR